MFQESSFCVVTGASKGIGRAIALKLAEQISPGSQIVLMSRNIDLLQTLESEIIEKNPAVTVSTLAMDLSKPNYANFLSAFANARAGKSFNSALLVQNAASFPNATKRAKEFSDLKQLQEYSDLNVHSFILLNNAFLEHCQKTENPIKKISLVDINSGASYKAHPCFHLYGAGKASRLAFYNSLAVEEPDLRILSYNPGPTNTEMTRELGRSAWSPDIRKRFQDGTSEGGIFPSPDIPAEGLMNILEKDEFKSGTLVTLQEKTLKFSLE